jgi:hypothetical protein
MSRVLAVVMSSLQNKDIDLRDSTAIEKETAAQFAMSFEEFVASRDRMQFRVILHTLRRKADNGALLSEVQIEGILTVGKNEYVRMYTIDNRESIRRQTKEEKRVLSVRQFVLLGSLLW